MELTLTPVGAAHNAQEMMDHSSMQGFRSSMRVTEAAHKRRVNDAARLYADTLNGRIDPVFIREAMNPRNEVLVAHLMETYPGIYGDPGGRTLGLRETMAVTDYQALFVDVLDRMYYGYYNAYPIVNKPLVKVHPLRDFRLVSRYMLDGAVTPLTSSDPGALPTQRALYGPAPQDGATPSTKATSTAPIQYQPKLYQAMTSVNWAAFVNDDLGIFQDLSNRLAIAGNRGISKFITGLFVDTNGPIGTLYSSSYANLINTANGAASTNPPLSIQGIQDGLKVLAGMLDSTGDPILMAGKLICWYGPAYAAVAKNLQNMLTSWIQVEGGTSNTQGFPAQFVQTTNWAIQNMEWIMDPYIPLVATSKKLTWGLSIDPGTLARPSVEMGFLNGFDPPQIFTRIPTTQRMGGGVDPTLGDFFSMNQDMKIVTVFGGTQIDGRGTVASNGSGS